ncbi:translation initiation factor IF-3 [Nitrincola iocasae]|uniref:Translation initiation factor IF-3 n=1 Tax=Nitrincola iocasae TaxID=2614693 RepID=A0A5J6LB25_9GAMM|nr:translation initiation factor IF-3 [Nitrincola iocasae]QEW05854.1 translation initiation factor IF-3 [Nitrincola iocasae]
MRRDNKRGGRAPLPPINENIRATELRLIAADGAQVGIVTIDQALELALASELDLVQISDSDPIVCKIMDYGKHQYELKKKANEAKKKQTQMQVKEVKFRPGTDEGDYQVKLRNLIRFLESGDKTKVTLRFRGREMAHQELGMQLLKRIEADLSEFGIVEQHPKMEGRQMVMVVAPKKK